MVKFTRKKYNNKRRKINAKSKKSKKRVLKRKQSKRLSRKNRLKKNRRVGGDWTSANTTKYYTVFFNYKFQTGEKYTINSGETLHVKMNNEEDFKPKIFDYIRISNHKEGTLSYTPSMIKFKDDLTEHRTRSIKFKYVSQFDFINSTEILMNVDEETTKNPPSPKKRRLY
jgi:hypothetical protein